MDLVVDGDVDSVVGSSGSGDFCLSACRACWRGQSQCLRVDAGDSSLV